MNLDEIRELIQLVNDTGVAELEVQRGENRVRIRRAIAAPVQEIVLPEAAPRVAAPNPGAVSANAQAPTSAEPAAPLAGTPEENLVLAKSPIVGTFYEAPSPGAPPFVQVGDTVHPGQVLCIIESMKLMNEIEAEVTGTIASKHVQNAQPVEYGEALFSIRPD
jgi:acetyl-CoA carboxylase biotin carboxyl carrier protein